MSKKEKELRSPDRDSNPSSSTAGFFQVPPRVDNQYFEDAALQRIITCELYHHCTSSTLKLTFHHSVYLPSTVRSAIEPDLSRFGQEVLTAKVLDWVADAEKNPPFLRTWDTWGRRRDELVTSAGWRNLQDMGIAEGMVAIAYERKLAEHSRLYQFIKFVRQTIILNLKACSFPIIQVSSLDRLLRHCNVP